MKEERKCGMEQMQQAMAELYEKQQQALQKFCPQCWGPLVVKDICAVTCPARSLDFTVEQILQGAIK